MTFQRPARIVCWAMNRVIFAKQSTMATAVLAAGVLTAASAGYVWPEKTSGVLASVPKPYVATTPAASIQPPITLLALATPNSLVAAAMRPPADIAPSVPAAVPARAGNASNSTSVLGDSKGIPSTFFAPSIISHFTPTSPTGDGPTTVMAHPLL